MRRIINFRDFNVYTLEKETWDIDYHNHNFYELIIIEKGKGKHRLNDVVFPYSKGDVYLLTPSDSHEFIVDKKTRFIYVKFTEQYLRDSLLWNKNNEAGASIKLLLASQSILNNSLVKDKQETALLLQLVQILHDEFVLKKTFHSETTNNLFACIMVVLTRSFLHLSNNKKWLDSNGNKITTILSYISIYAFDKEKMKIKNLSKEFLMSKNYISIYVKKQSGISIQNHISQYKIKAAEKLLMGSKFNINEISEKLGFNDSSHFNKIFKKHFGVSPIAFRQKLGNV